MGVNISPDFDHTILYTMKYYYATLLAILFALFGCNSTVRDSLSLAENLMLEQPDSAKIVLDRIKRTDLKNRALKARFALLYSQAMDKCYIDTDNDSLIRIAVNYYSKRGSDHEKAMAYYYNSAVAKNAKEFDKEVEYLVRAQEYAEKTDDAYLKGLIYSLLAQKYYMQFSFEEALLLYEKSAKEFEKTGNLTNQLYAYSGIHNSLLCLDRVQESIPSAQKALELAKALNRTTEIAIWELGIMYIGNKIHNVNDIRRGKYLLTLLDKSNDVEQYRRWGYIYCVENKLDSAIYYYNEYIANLSSFNIRTSYPIIELAKLYRQIGQNDKAILYMNKYINVADSINKTEREVLVQSLEKKYKTQQIRESYAALRKQHTLFVVLCVLIVILLIIGVVYVFNRYKSKIAKIQQESEASIVQYVTLQKQYDTLLRNMGAYTKENGEQGFKLVEVLHNRLNGLRELSEFAYYYGDTDSSKRFYKKFKEHIIISRNKNAILADDIIDMANMLNNGIITYLKEHYPTITTYELSYCGLISLGFTPESIRILLNHSNNHSLYIVRTRISKKIGLNRALHIEEFILSLCNTLSSK